MTNRTPNKIRDALATREITKYLKHTAEVNTALNNLPFATKISAEIIKFTERYSSVLHSKFANEPALCDLDRNTIKEKISSFVMDFLTSRGIVLDDFDYRAHAAFLKLQTYTKAITNVRRKAVKQEMTTLPLDLARRFLDTYNYLLVKQKQLRHTLQHSKPSELTKEKLRVAQQKINELHDAIAAMKAETTPTVTIPFPPHESLEDYSADEVALIQSMPNASDAITQFKKQVSLLNSLERKMLASIKHTHENDFRSVEVAILLSRNNKDLGEKILLEFAKNIAKKLDDMSFDIPLDKKRKAIIETFLDINHIIQLRGADSSNYAELQAIMEPRHPEQCKKILDDSEAITQYETRKQTSGKKSNISRYLNQNEEKFLELHQNLIFHYKSMPSSALNFLAVMLEKNIGNMSFNKRLSHYAKDKSSRLQDKYKPSINRIKEFIFKTRFSHLNEYIINKCQTALTSLQKGETLDPTKQLSFFEYGKLHHLAKIKPILDAYERCGIIQRSNKLRKLYEHVLQASELINQIESEIAREHTFKGGDILVVNSQKNVLVRNKTNIGMKTKFTQAFVSKYDHAAQVYFEPTTHSFAQSHIIGEYVSKKISIDTLAASDIFRIDVLKLILPSVKETLRKFYAERNLDYSIEVPKLFEQTLNRLHATSQARWANIENQAKRQILAAIAPHTRYQDANRLKTYQKMYGTDGFEIKNPMICSEFVAKSITAALFKTNEIIADDLKQDGIDLPQEIIRIPLKKEKLRRMHPGRLVEQLMREGCLVQVASPPILSALINQESLTPRVNLLDTEGPGAALYPTLVSLALSFTDVHAFVPAAMSAFESYALNEKLTLNFEDEVLKNYLTTGFTNMYEAIQKTPNSVGEIVLSWLKNFAKWLGFHFKEAAQVTLEKTIRDIEKVQVDAIKEKYKPQDREPRPYSLQDAEKISFFGSERSSVAEPIEKQKIKHNP